MNSNVVIRYSIVAIHLSLLIVKLKLALPYRSVWIKWSSSWDKTCSLIFLILFKRVCLRVWKLGQWRKKCVVGSESLPQSHNGFRVSWKQCLNLWPRRWLKPSCNLIRSLIPYGLWISKILFTQGRIKFSRFFLNIERFPEFLILQSKLFHSNIVEGRNEFLKLLCFVWIAGILLLCLISRSLFKLEIKSKRYDGNFSFNIL